ncbi:MAG: HAMP domain-containing sensor histidine kinase [Polyangiaceae bacterium]
MTIAQVVHDYGDLCQVITGLSLEQKKPISADEFQTLNLCLDDAIAGAVTAYARLRERAITDEGTERLGFLAHEMRNVLNTAMLAFGSLQRGTALIGGSTGALLARSHTQLQALIDRSMADVRLDAGMQNMERVPVCELIEEVEIGASMVAQARGLHLTAAPVDPSIIVEADRQILAAALANLVQNAIKFTLPGTTVAIRASTTVDRVLIEVEDECGGLPPGKVEHLLRPFVQRSGDRTGLGLGLIICLKAVKAIAGELHIRDLPGKGCIFSPRLRPPSTPANESPGASLDRARRRPAQSKNCDVDAPGPGSRGAALCAHSSLALRLESRSARAQRAFRLLASHRPVRPRAQDASSGRRVMGFPFDAACAVLEDDERLAGDGASHDARTERIRVRSDPTRLAEGA